MKTIRSLIALTLVLAAANALAGDKPKEASVPPSKPAAQNQKPQKALVTGSYLKQEVRRNGTTASEMNNVVVFDSKTIQKSGASDLTQLLVRKGVIR